MWGGERGEQPSSSVGRRDRGRCGGAGTLHGAGTKGGSQNAANDKVKVHASVVAKLVVWGLG